MSVNKYIKLLLIPSCLIFLSSCHTLSPLGVLAYTPISSGVLKGHGIKIEAMDGSFVIKEGHFIPPFQSECSSGSWSPDYLRIKNKDVPILNYYQDALGCGAKKVRVYHPASNQPLYGILMLNKRLDSETDLSSRSYLIQIPDKYVYLAEQDKTSIVYETSSPSNSSITTYTWALWLSTTPF